eukprot:5095175-Prymnesium_polylepis.3
MSSGPDGGGRFVLRCGSTSTLALPVASAASGCISRIASPAFFRLHRGTWTALCGGSTTFGGVAGSGALPIATSRASAVLTLAEATPASIACLRAF